MKRAKAGEIDAFIKLAIAHDGDGCLLWPYGRQSAGYAHFGRDNKFFLVSRLICEALNGPPTAERPWSLHSCGNGHLGCVSGAHLRWGSQKENQEDMVAHGRSARGARRCTAKLTEQGAAFIKANRHVLTPTEISLHIGVTRDLIYPVLRGKSWAWVPDPLVAA